MTRVPSQSEFVPTDSEYTLRDQEHMQLARNYFEWQAELVNAKAGERILEIGCGVGNFTKYILDRELVVGLDIEPKCVQKMRATYQNRANLVVVEMDVADAAFVELNKYCCDTIVCLNVLEHVRDDQSALETMREVLVAGGRVVLIVPAFAALYGPIDARLGHYRRYTRRSLLEVARRAGYGVSVLRYINPLGCIGWWMNARIFKKTEQSEGQIRVFDGLIVPWQCRLESILRPPFGQSIFAVLQRDG